MNKEELREKIAKIVIDEICDICSDVRLGKVRRIADQTLALLELKMSVLSEEEIVKIFQEVRELNGSDLDIIHALSGKIISAGRNAGKSTGSFGKAADTTIGGISKPQDNFPKQFPISACCNASVRKEPCSSDNGYVYICEACSRSCDLSDDFKPQETITNSLCDTCQLSHIDVECPSGTNRIECDKYKPVCTCLLPIPDKNKVNAFIDKVLNGSQPKPSSEKIEKVSIKIEPDAYVSHRIMIDKINELIERANRISKH